MEIREVRKELKDYTRNKRYIERKQEEISRLEEQICKVTATYSDMPRGGNGNGKEDLIATKLDLEREVYDYLIELVKQKAQIESVLRKIEPKYRNILDGIFIEGKTLVEVAAEESYSYSQIKRLLKDAYKSYAAIREEFRNEVI